MNPYLSHTGRLVVFTGLVFTITGIAASNVAILLLGQLQLVLLASAFLLVAPVALSLDRRMVRLEVEPGEATSLGTGHIVGEDVDVELHAVNESEHTLHNLRATPFGAEALRAADVDVAVHIPPGASGRAEFDVTAKRSGRWMLHGFDVRATDPLGLVETRDYLPCNHAFEFYPAAGMLARRASTRPPQTSLGGGPHLAQRVGSGSEIRQLRDWRPGDSLRDVAWKASLRSRKLVSREFEREVTANVYIALDVSSSMRGGRAPGQKLEWAVHYTVGLATQLLETRDRVGLLTFDEKMYGHVAPGNSTRQMQKILHHLVGLNSVVDQELTELDETEVERLAADYLLVQERLDFRRGGEGNASGVNRKLLDRWLQQTMPYVRERFESGTLREGVVESDVSELRQFLGLRGVTIPYRVEARLGMKERGLVQTLEHVVGTAREPHWIVLISDLCAVMNVESIVRGVNLARADGHTVEVVVPFTPWFYPAEPDQPKYEIIRELFTSAEAEERSRVVRRLRAMGVTVHMTKGTPV